MTHSKYPPLPRGNPELGQDSYNAQHMTKFADDTCELRSGVVVPIRPPLQTGLLVFLIATAIAFVWMLPLRDNDDARGLAQFRETCSTDPTWAIRFNADGSSTFVATCSPARK